MDYSEIANIIKIKAKKQIKDKDLAATMNITPETFSRKKKSNELVSDVHIKLLEKEYKIHLDTQNFSENEIIADYYEDVFGSCGSGSFVLSENKSKIAIPRDCFNHYSSVKKYSVINARGDSMCPFIQSKDKLLVEHLDNGEQIIDNQVYVFCYDNAIFVKRLIKNVNELVIVSDNPDKELYKTIRLVKEEMNDVIIIGQIVGLIRDLRN